MHHGTTTEVVERVGQLVIDFSMLYRPELLLSVFFVMETSLEFLSLLFFYIFFSARMNVSFPSQSMVRHERRLLQCEVNKINTLCCFNFEIILLSCDEMCDHILVFI